MLMRVCYNMKTSKVVKMQQPLTHMLFSSRKKRMNVWHWQSRQGLSIILIMIMTNGAINCQLSKYLSPISLNPILNSNTKWVVFASLFLFLIQTSLGKILSKNKVFSTVSIWSHFAVTTQKNSWIQTLFSTTKTLVKSKSLFSFFAKITPITPAS